MNDLEDRLRADFQQATAGVEDTVDVEAALLAGQRARSSRRIARTAGAAAIVAVAGLVGWGALRAAPVLGGHPDPMGTISAVPNTPSTSSSPYVPTDPMSATFELGGKINGQVPSYESVEVAVKSNGDQVDVSVSMNKGTDKAAGTILRQYTMTSGKFWYVALDKNLVLSIVPGRTNWFQTRDDATKGSVTYTEPLTGINATAYLTGYLKSGELNLLRGFLWEGTDGVVHDSLGNVVPSAEIALSGDTYLIYRDVALDVGGVAPRQGGGFAFHVRDLTPGDLLDGGLGRQDDDGTWTWARFGCLPPGAHDITVELAPGDGSWASAVLSDGTVAVLAVNHSKSDRAKVVTSISYRDANGKLVLLPK